MHSAVLDTSVLVRFLTNDDPAKATAAAEFLRSAPTRSLLLPDVAVAELIFVLLRVYRWPVSHVADAIRAIVSHPAIDVSQPEVCLDVADDLIVGHGPVDAYLQRVAQRAGIPAVVTFDEAMKQVPDVRSVRP